jgi:U3 small nucleolar RNA-associated protein 7
MIALDPDFVGSLAPPTKLTTAVHDRHDIPFARLPRLERLRVEGKADDTELDGGVDADGGEKKSREEREKRKMRGKGKSLKRCVTLVVRQTRVHVAMGDQVSEEAAQERDRPYRGSYDVPSFFVRVDSGVLVF